MRLAASKYWIPIGLILASCASPVIGKGIVVKPARLQISSEPGAAGGGRLTVSATTTEKTRVRVSVEDFILAEDGQPQRAVGIAGEHSAASEVLVDPAEFTLQGGRDETVLVHCRPRPAATGPYWALLVFDVEGVPVSDTGGRSTLVASRILVPVFGNAGVARSGDLRVAELSGQKPVNGLCRARAVVENSGGAILEVIPEWVLFRRFKGRTEEVVRRASASVLILPGGRRRLESSFDCSQVPEEGLGVYLSIRYGEDSGSRAEATAPLSPSEGSPAKN